MVAYAKSTMPNTKELIFIHFSRKRFCFDWTCHTERAVFTFCGKLAAPAFTWQRLVPMERLAFSIGKVNCKIELFCRREYSTDDAVGWRRCEDAVHEYFDIQKKTFGFYRLCSGFAWDCDGDLLGIITSSSSQVNRSQTTTALDAVKFQSIFVCCAGNFMGYKHTTKAYHRHRSS